MSIYIGYDLGDGDTSVSLYHPDKGIESIGMPGMQGDGVAMPTLLAVDKEGKTRVGFYAMQTQANTLDELDINFKQKPTELSPDELERYKRRVVSFTDSLFHLIAKSCYFNDDNENHFIIAVGRPTTWSQEDVELYASFFNECEIVRSPGSFTSRDVNITVLFQLFAESNAALMNFLNSKNSDHEYALTVEQLPKGSCAVVFDFGSSTADVTVLRNNNGTFIVERNSGDHRLGARLIDSAMYSTMLTKISPKEQSEHQRKLEANPPLKAQCICSCRITKQNYFNAPSDVQKQNNFSVEQVRTAGFHFDDYINHELMQQVMKTNFKELGNVTWEKACRNLFKKVEAEFAGEVPAYILLTGGASRMPFIKEIAQETFPNSQVVVDLHPSTCISHGLAYLPFKMERARNFLEDVKRFCSERIPEIIQESIPSLATSLSTSLTSKILDSVKDDVFKWRRGGYMTLNSMERNIRSNVESLLKSYSVESSIKSAIRDMVVQTIAPKVEKEFEAICIRHRISISSGSTDASTIQGRARLATSVGIADKISGAIDDILRGDIVRVLVASVIFCLTPVVLLLVASIGIPIVSGIAAALFAVMAACPPAYPILAIIVGVSVFYLLAHGTDGVKQMFMQKVKAWDLPKWIRERVSSEKIRSIISEESGNVSAQLKAGILKDNTFKSEITDSVGKGLSTIINASAQDLALRIRD